VIVWTTSLISLVVIIVLCFFGVFGGTFKDNVLQRVGMGVIVLAACGRVWQLWISDVTDGLFVLYLGVAIYAVGTTSKVLVHHGRERGWRMVMDFDRWLWNRKTASGEFDDRPHHHV
jgi:hypothetical protein